MSSEEKLDNEFFNKAYISDMTASILLPTVLVGIIEEYLQYCFDPELYKNIWDVSQYFGEYLYDLKQYDDDHEELTKTILYRNPLLVYEHIGHNFYTRYNVGNSIDSSLFRIKYEKYTNVVKYTCIYVKFYKNNHAEKDFHMINITFRDNDLKDLLNFNKAEFMNYLHTLPWFNIVSGQNMIWEIWQKVFKDIAIHFMKHKSYKK